MKKYKNKKYLENKVVRYHVWIPSRDCKEER
jgi:hypothetical protein